MTKKIVIFLLLLYTLIVGGCAREKSLYHWGDYSKTLYHLRKDVNDTTREQHMTELEAIVKVSKESNLSVPPGVYCELGYMYANKGNNKEALDLFVLEKTTYPESTILVNRLIARINPADNDRQQSKAVDNKN